MKKSILIVSIILFILLLSGFLFNKYFLTKENIDFDKIFTVGSFGVSGKSLALPTETIGESVEDNYFENIKLNPFEEKT